MSKPLANKTLEEFRELLRAWCEENDPECKEYPNWLRKDFWTYWTSKNDGGRKMYFQMQDKWSTGLRLATWKRNTLKDPRWKKEVDKSKIYYQPKRLKEGQMALPGVNYNKFKA